MAYVLNVFGFKLRFLYANRGWTKYGIDKLHDLTYLVTYNVDWPKPNRGGNYYAHKHLWKPLFPNIVCAWFDELTSNFFFFFLIPPDWCFLNCFQSCNSWLMTNMLETGFNLFWLDSLIFDQISVMLLSNLDQSLDK